MYGEYGRSDDEEHEGVELVPNVLIIKIPEPLTFANTGSLKDRLRRLEDHGTAAKTAAPDVPKLEHKKNVIFDIHGVTKLDPAAAQVLMEIVQDYVERGTNVFFCRVPGRKTEVWRLMNVSGIYELCGGEHHFLPSVDAALRATEREGSVVFGEDFPDGPPPGTVGSSSWRPGQSTDANESGNWRRNVSVA